MTKYVIKNKATGRFYVSSKANGVDPFDIHFAKIFPTLRSARAAMPHFDQWYRNPTTGNFENEYPKGWQPTVFEVETQVLLKDEVVF